MCSITDIVNELNEQLELSNKLNKLLRKELIEINQRYINVYNNDLDYFASKAYISKDDYIRGFLAGLDYMMGVEIEDE